MSRYIDILSTLTFPPLSRIPLDELREVQELFEEEDYPMTKRGMVEVIFLQLVADEGAADENRRKALAETALRATERVSEAFGGVQVYVNKRVNLAALRRANIVKEFNGRNLTELAAKYRLSEQAVRHALWRHRDVVDARRKQKCVEDEQRSQRDASILSEFNGHNTKNLAAKNGLSEDRVRAIIRAHRSSRAECL